MTCFALLPERFINHDESLIFHLHGKMTFFTGRFFVRAVELEGAVAIMHEQQFAPQRRLMTFFATHRLLFSKLAAMHILMAIGATKRQRLVTYKRRWQHAVRRRHVRASRPCHQIRALKGGLRPGIFARMAFAARHFLMRANQREARGVVIELGFMPIFITMANIAAVFGQARGKLSRMHIRMAGRATLIRKNEQQLAGKLASLLAKMTDATGGGEMAAEQRENRFLMFCQHELRRHEAFHRMAAFAAAFVRAPCELCRVRILMAIAAELMRQFLFKISANVASFTEHFDMLAAQREIRQIMIERAGWNLFPIFRGVAFFAVIAESAAMRVLMARNAI